ncbi:MAG: DNA polymerase IV [Bullifex sp.]
MSEPLFFHVDLDAFFASVEILDNPSLKGKPLIIGHNGPRSVVSTCSYEARKYGVHSAMPMSQALRLCPRAVVISGHMKRYGEMSRRVMEVLRDYAPEMLQASIDEAYLDMSGTENIYGSSADSARRLKKLVYDTTGLTCSIGVGSSRFIAKLASDYRKPDGLTVVPPGLEERFVDAVGLKKLWGVGKVTQDALTAHRLMTPEDIRSCSLDYLMRTFGRSSGEYLWKVSRGIDPGIYSGEAKSHSISAERTFWPDLMTAEASESFLLELSEEVMFRSIDEGFMARTCSVKIRYASFKTYTLQVTPQDSVLTSSDLYMHVKNLFRTKYTGEGIRLLGVGLSGLYKGDEPEQPDLFSEDRERKRKLERTVLELRKKGSRIGRASSGMGSGKEKHHND